MLQSGPIAGTPIAGGKQEFGAATGAANATGPHPQASSRARWRAKAPRLGCSAERRLRKVSCTPKVLGNRLGAWPMNRLSNPNSRTEYPDPRRSRSSPDRSANRAGDVGLQPVDARAVMGAVWDIGGNPGRGRGLGNWGGGPGAFCRGPPDRIPWRFLRKTGPGQHNLAGDRVFGLALVQSSGTPARQERAWACAVVSRARSKARRTGKKLA